MEAILLVHVAATWFMVGLIWFIQLVHYPLFHGVGPEPWTAYAAAHTRRTTWVVGPAMAAEAITGMLLLRSTPPGIPQSAIWAGLGLLLVIWVSTAFIQVPRHRLLASGFDRDAWQALVATNWLRTAAWSARGLLVLGILVRVVNPAP
jgi:hypothetical protein